MEFLLGLIVGWFAMPYVLFGTIWFFLMFPVLFLGVDIYHEYRWKYHFWRVVFFTLVSGVALHFFTPFDVFWLATGSFWLSALQFTGWIIAYLLAGILYAYLRWFFYLRRYNRLLRKDYPPVLTEVHKAEIRTKRLSNYDSRLSLILKWIFYWPWSALAWMLTDMLREFMDFAFRRAKAFFGAGFGNMARADEKKVFGDLSEPPAQADASTNASNTR